MVNSIKIGLTPFSLKANMCTSYRTHKQRIRVDSTYLYGGWLIDIFPVSEMKQTTYIKLSAYGASKKNQQEHKGAKD